MNDKIVVRCQKNGADYCAPFADGKRYVATHYRNALWSVRDDIGHVRYIIPDERCPHLQKMSQSTIHSAAVGVFVTESGT